MVFVGILADDLVGTSGYDDLIGTLASFSLRSVFTSFTS